MLMTPNESKHQKWNALNEITLRSNFFCVSSSWSLTFLEVSRRFEKERLFSSGIIFIFFFFVRITSFHYPVFLIIKFVRKLSMAYPYVGLIICLILIIGSDGEKRDLTVEEVSSVRCFQNPASVEGIKCLLRNI